MLLPGADPLRVSAACEAVIAWAHARQLEAIHAVDEQSPEFFDNTGVLANRRPQRSGVRCTGLGARRGAWTWPRQSAPTFLNC